MSICGQLKARSVDPVLVNWGVLRCLRRADAAQEVLGEMELSLDVAALGKRGRDDGKDAMLIRSDWVDRKSSKYPVYRISPHSISHSL